MQLRTQKVLSQEDLLLEYADRFQRHREGRKALWLHLSRLARENRHVTDIRLAANLLRPVAKAFHGEVFVLRSGDVVLTLKDPVQTMVDSALFQVRYSFSRDPLIRRVDDEGDEVYLTEFLMEQDYESFVQACKDAKAKANEEVAATAKRRQPQDEDAEQPRLGPRLIVSAEPSEEQASADESEAPQGLAKEIEIGGASLPLSKVVRRQLICTSEKDEKQLAIGLRHEVPAKAIDEFGHLALCHARGQITEREAVVEIERTVLPVLVSEIVTETIPVSLLSVRLETIMSAEFAVVLRAIEGKSQTDVWLGIHAGDAHADPETATYAHSFLKKRGLMVGLTDLTPSLAPQLVRLLAGMSFAEIAPSPGKPMPAQFVSGLVRLMDANNIIVSSSTDQAQHDELTQAGARRFVVGSN